MSRIIELLKIEIYSFLYSIFYYMPGYYFSNKFRGFYLNFFLKKCGKKFILNKEVVIESPNNIIIGNNVQINTKCWISGGGGLEIGNNVLIGPHTVIHSANHNYRKKNILINQQGHSFEKVIIEDDVWIAANCTIVPGVIIAKGCVIGAGAVVTKNTEPYKIYAGVPAKKIGERS